MVRWQVRITFLSLSSNSFLESCISWCSHRWLWTSRYFILTLVEADFMSALAHFISCNLCASFVRRGQRLSQKLHRLLLSQLGRLHRTHLIDMSDHICLFLIKWEQICLEIILIRLATTVFTDLLILVNFIPTSVCLLVYKLSATLIRFDRMLRDWHNPGLRHHDRGLVHIRFFF